MLVVDSRVLCNAVRRVFETEGLTTNEETALDSP
jgi:hypothetical protein